MPQPPIPPRQEYEQRLHAVLRHIDAHLHEPLDLPQLAAVAHFSAFHFHRLFVAWTGETLGDYLQRRRIHIAAGRLAAQPRLTVLELALGVGFGSGEAFSRAFRKRMGLTPSQWRLQALQSSNPDQAQRNPDQVGELPFFKNGAISSQRMAAMHVEVRELPPVQLAYLRYEGPYGPPVGRFWRERFLPWVQGLGLTQAAQYGISHDDPHINDPQRCRYDACVVLPAGFSGPGSLLRCELPGGRYACMPFFDNGTRISEAWGALLRDWVPQSGWQLSNRPCFEYYPPDARFDAATGAFECEICIPVEAL